MAEQRVDTPDTSPETLRVVTIMASPGNVGTGREHYFVTLEDGSIWYVKPDRAKGHPDAMRERAAWAVLEQLGWSDLSSHVFIRSLQLPDEEVDSVCSLMAWEDDMDPTTDVADHKDEDTQRAAVFDYLRKETDRHLANFGRSPARALYLYDHAASFLSPVVPAHSEFVNRWRKRVLPAVIRDRARDCCANQWQPVLDPSVGKAHRLNFEERLHAFGSDGQLLA